MSASVTLVALQEAADFSSPTLPDTDFATMLSFRRDNTGRLPRPVAAIERRWHNAQDGTKVGLLDPQDGGPSQRRGAGALGADPVYSESPRSLGSRAVTAFNALEHHSVGLIRETPMNTPCIITVAITGSLPQKSDNPAVPISIAEQIESTHASFEAGATLVHAHVRNDDGSPTSDPERFGRLLEGLRKHCPGMIIQFSTGGRSGAGRERGGMIPFKPDMCSLATGSCNFPMRVYENSPDLVDWLAAEMQAHGVKPEIEAFDLSMIFKAVEMQKTGKIKGPLHVQFVMGVKNAMPVDREVFEFYVATLKRLTPDATWTGAGIGRDQITLNRWSLELGGHCRTGLEDNVRLDRATLAPSNAALVKRVSDLAGAYNRRPATVAEARQLLRLTA